MMKKKDESKISIHLKSILEGNNKQIFQSVKYLISDLENRKIILEKLEHILKLQSQVINGPIPRGLQSIEKKKYLEMNKASIIAQSIIQTFLGILGPKTLLDSDHYIRLIDKSGMLERLGRWREHINTMKERATSVAKIFKQKYKDNHIKKVKIYGLGGSGAPHDIAVDIINNSRKSSTEIHVIHADTPNPDQVDENTLVLLCSFSGNTEETINCYHTIKNKTNLFIVIARGGELLEIAKKQQMPFIKIPDKKSHPAFVKQPRESVCLQMTATLVFLIEIGLKSGSSGKFKIDDFQFENDVFPLLLEWRNRFGPQVPYDRNPAKQLAFFLLYGFVYPSDEKKYKEFNIWDKKIPYVLVDYNNNGIGHEVRTQIHERSKLNAAFYVAPELLHNFVESLRANLESSIFSLDKDQFVYYFIRSVDEQERIRLRLNETIKLVVKDKGNYAILNSEGKNPYERALFATYFNAHMTTYLAILNGFDPLPVPTMSWIKNVMNEFPRSGEEETNAQNKQLPLLQIYEKKLF